ncbi:CoA-transferase [Kribbella sp. NPDC023972]|uniref:CoA-transferase subunit beta n=1 Tax=Kribbella sp. NPDC023972 TaxID=3154795 RepID=UPI0033EDA969
MMNVAAARELSDGDVCLVGVGPPNLAANLARRTHAPNCRLVYESGAIDAKPRRLPLSIGDDDLAATATAVVSVPEMFNYWVGAGRIDVGFLGAAQIDRYGNINTTVIGEHGDPKTRLPGAGGAPEIAAAAGRVIVIVKQSPRTFVERVDFVTSVGYGPTGRERRAPGAGPTLVITDHGVLEPDPETNELTLTRLHPGVTVAQAREATGWDLKVADSIKQVDPPTDVELTTLHRLRDREDLDA